MLFFLHATYPRCLGGTRSLREEEFTDWRSVDSMLSVSGIYVVQCTWIAKDLKCHGIDRKS